MAQAKSAETLLAAAAVSAVVATLVSLAVEWFAKPSLEARKDRILQRSRARRESVKQLLRIRELSIRLSNHRLLGGSMKQEEKAKVNALYKSLHDELLLAVERFDSSFTEVIDSSRDPLYSRTTAYLGLVAGMTRSDGTWKEQGKAIALSTYPLLDLWTTTKWHPIARRRHQKGFDAVVQAYRNNPWELLDMV